MGDIFDNKNLLAPRPTSQNWFKFKNIGDSIAGTLVGVYSVVNPFSTDNSVRSVYAIKMSSGEEWNVQGKAAIDKEMKDNNVKIGQIIGLKFVALGTPPKPGLNKPHIIKVFSEEKDNLDLEWLKATGREAVLAFPTDEDDTETPSSISIPTPGNTTATPPPPAPAAVSSTADVPFLSQTEKIAKIYEIAKTKLGASTAEEIKTKVEEKSGLIFNEANVEAIYEQLKNL